MKLIKSGLLALSLFAVAGCANQSGAMFGSGPDGPVDVDSVEYLAAEIGDTVLFVVDQHAITDQARVILDAQAQWLNQHPDFQITIQGHADEQGTREYNLALGARRAASVRNYLVSQGVLEGRIKIETFGKERPVAVCSNERCWTQNRRAVTVVVGGFIS